MKRLVFLFLAIALLGAASARAEFRYGPIAGVTVSHLSFKQDLVDVDQAVGYQAGIQGELMFPGIGFGIDLGLIYNQANANVNLGQRLIWSSQGFGREKVMLHSILIPVHVRFKWTRMNGLEDKIAPLVYFGPDFNINCGHNKIRGFEGVGNPFSYAGGGLGLTVGLGAELWKNWQLTASYTWGMTYALKTRLLDDFSARSSQWTVRVAYLF
ncbi:MAG: porin family protein [Muribaculaceae bacterium]|nr:porin family protein [Muribaculaceae bacterium]